MMSIIIFICTLIPYNNHIFVDSESIMQLTLFRSILIFLHLKDITGIYSDAISHKRHGDIIKTLIKIGQHTTS